MTVEIIASVAMGIFGNYLSSLLTRENRDNSLRTYALFETLVFKLLEEHLQSQSKKIVGLTEPNSAVDYLLPQGIDNINEPIGLIIKIVKNDNNAVWAATRRSCERFIEEKRINRLLFIFGVDITQDKKDELKTFILKKTGLPADIWDLKDLDMLIEKHSGYWAELVQNADKVFVNAVINRSIVARPDHWKEKRQEYIKQLNEVYKKDDLVLFLGAGVSKTAKISDWNVLVTDLLVTMISEKLKDNKININSKEQGLIIDQIKKDTQVSPLLQARYIRTGLGKNFISAISKALYKNINNKTGGTSELLKSITQLCTPKRNSLGMKSVVTYNFDDLLESHLRENNIACIPVYKDSDTCSNEELPIYHVHGYLPRNSNETDEFTNSLLVFSEEGYHAVMIDPYCWSNITQLNLLRENTCLMVGLSLTDPNLRRLLDIAARKSSSPRHFAILKRQAITLDSGGVRENAIQSFINVDQDLKEESYRELGLNIIWVDDYNEIPMILNSIRN